MFHRFIKESLDLGRRVIEKLKGLSDFKYRIGIGRKHRAKNFGKSCSEAHIAASRCHYMGTAHYEDVKLTDNSVDTYPLHKENTFTNSIIAANIKEATDAFQEIYLWIGSAYGDDIDRIKSKLMELLFIIDKKLPYKLKEIDNLKKAFILNIHIFYTNIH
jgi:two-component system response regulator YesN